MPSPKVTNPSQLEEAIKQAASQGILVDKRTAMPRGRNPDKSFRTWSIRLMTDILGACLHQTASPNRTDPVKTGVYLTSPHNHISEQPLPSIPYHFMIPDTQDPPWLTADLTWKTWAQGASTPGAENLALVAIAYMGSFKAPGWNTSYTTAGPSDAQVLKGTKLLLWLFDQFGWDWSHLFGHYHFNKAACPGAALQAVIEGLRNQAPKLESNLEWQKALLAWNPTVLPKYGPDGDWGAESKGALCRFQRANRLDCTGQQDPFTQLKLFPLLYPEGKFAAADYHVEAAPGGVMLKLDSATAPGFPPEKFVPLSTEAVDPSTGEVGDLRDPNFVMGTPPGTFVVTSGTDNVTLGPSDEIICSKCGADLIEGKCPECDASSSPQ